MLKIINIEFLIISIFLCLLFSPNTFSLSPTILSNMAVLIAPVYSKVHVPDIDSKLYVNTGIIGKVVIVREIRSDGSLGPKYSFDFKQINENWAELIFETPLSRFNEVILLGSSGNLQISKSKSGEDILLYDNGTSAGKFVVRFGTANETIYFPDFDIQDIESIDVGLVDDNGEKINGSAVVASDRFLVLQFDGIKPEYIKNGQVKLVIRFRAQSLLADLDSWGYDFDISKTDNTKKHLTSNIYGLNPDKKIKIYYEVYEGQAVEPTAEVFTVKELNDGKTFAIIEDNNSPIKLDFIIEE
ncbi:MAG: hypothetical protein ACR2NW_06175 [Thermodesulfobacteriota bacterium]